VLSPLIASLIGHVTFWILMAWGWATGSLEPRPRWLFVALWLAGLFGLPYFPNGAALFAPYVAVLDIALVFIIFKGDVTVT
jgi:hypothetical protein